MIARAQSSIFAADKKKQFQGSGEKEPLSFEQLTIERLFLVTDWQNHTDGHLSKLL